MAALQSKVGYEEGQIKFSFFSYRMKCKCRYLKRWPSYLKFDVKRARSKFIQTDLDGMLINTCQMHVL